MLRWMVFLLIWPFAALADGAPGVPPALRAQILERPARFEAAAAAVILGYGTSKGINAQGLEDYLAVERAKLRVREMRQMMLADLDDDGAVTQREVIVAAAAQRVRARGRLWQAHRAADTNGDSTVTLAEPQAHARLAATDAVAREAGIRDLMRLDFDGDGFVSMQELRQALSIDVPET